MDAMKPGYKTTEFYLTVLCHVLNVLVMSGVMPVQGVASQVCVAALAVLAQLGYTSQRASLKRDAQAKLAEPASDPDEE